MSALLQAVTLCCKDRRHSFYHVW